MRKVTLSIALLAIAIAGCSKKSEEANTAPAAPSAVQQEAAPAPAPAPTPAMEPAPQEQAAPAQQPSEGGATE